MAFDFSKLRGKIKRVFGTETKFGEAVGMARSTLTHKLNGKTAWSHDEMVKTLTLLEVPLDKVDEYFFSPIE